MLKQLSYVSFTNYTNYKIVLYVVHEWPPKLNMRNSTLRNCLDIGLICTYGFKIVLSVKWVF